MSRSSILIDSKLPDEGDIIYFNLNLTNMTTQPIPAQVIEQRSQPIIDRPGAYEMSVVRFQISSSLIPLFFPIVLPSTLQTNMGLCLTYLGVSYPAPIYVQAQDVQFGVFDISGYINYINIAFTLAYVSLTTAFPLLPMTQAPLLNLNPQTGMISIYLQTLYIVGGIGIGFNWALQQLLNFPTTAYYGNAQPNFLDYQVDLLSTTIAIPPSGVRYTYPVRIIVWAGDVVQIQQEYSCLWLWQKVKSILFTSNLLPINAEIIPNSTTGSFASGQLQIISDFDFARSGPIEFRSIVQYLPTAEYRIITLNGNTSVNQIDITAYWTDNLDHLYPVYLDADTNMSMKIMFRRIA